MQANVIVLAAPKGVERLTYEVPAGMRDLVRRGHRVLVPMRSRRVTGVVVELGERLRAAAAGTLKPVAEILEAEPLLDEPHLALMEFLASYYLVPLSEAYRSLIPGAFRVETRSFIKLAREPDPLALASFNRAERAIVEALAKRPMTARQLARLAGPEQAAAALAVLDSHHLLERQGATRGRHRDPAATWLARLKDGAGASRAVRGARQKQILALIQDAPEGALPADELEAQLPGARSVLKNLAARGLIDLTPLRRPSIASAAEPPADSLALSDEQAAVLEAVSRAMERRRFETFLLWGVTASGKTEVYLQLAAQSIRQGRQVLILVPEIALTDELVRSFRSRFGSLAAVAHSGQSLSERWASFTAALSGEARIMIGPRSVIFAPIHGLGLIVVDEEHDSAYKQEEGIRYHARDLAVVLGRLSRCPVVLGSATPSAESFANARSGRYRMLRLSRRIQDRPLAAVEVIDLRGEFGKERQKAAAEAVEKGPPPVPLSAALVQAFKENLAAGGQSLVFINRRGYHHFLQCHLCGNVISCPNCSVSMTFHLRDRSLRCHYCGERDPAPAACPECRGLGLEGQGFGTERLASALAEILPGARIERMDSDTSRLKGARSRILEALRGGEIDVLVGTQMITKGFDFPGVTLVGVVAADQALNMPDFRSAERTFQLLTQVAGRAGRGERPGRVLIQTYAPHHYSIRAAEHQDYARFIRRELDLRRQLMYPPYVRMALVRVEGAEARRVEQVALAAAAALAPFAAEPGLRVLGPAPAPIERIKQRYRWQVVVKASALGEMRRALAAMRARVAPLAERHQVRVAIDLDPVNML